MWLKLRLKMRKQALVSQFYHSRRGECVSEKMKTFNVNSTLFQSDHLISILHYKSDLIFWCPVFGGQLAWEKKKKKLPTILKSYSGHWKMTNLLWRSARSTTRTTSFAKQDSTQFLFSIWCWHTENVCEQLAKPQIQSSLKWNLSQNQVIFNRQHVEQSQ